MMGDYRHFDQLRTSELMVSRHKWFFPYYELTDGQFVYGKLSYKSSFKRYAVIETAQGTWTVKRQGFFDRTLLINRNEDETIGTLKPATWKRNIDIQMNDGFTATYLYKKLFAKSLTLTSDALGDVLQVTQRPFGFKTPFAITLNKIYQQQNMPPLPLLILIGVSMTLMRQQQQAAAH